MRESCLDCARKHIAEAECLAREALLGYPMHRWLAIGHLAQAEAELLNEYPAYATVIRQHRLVYPDVPIPTIELLEMLSEDVPDMPSRDRSEDGILPDPLDTIESSLTNRHSEELQKEIQTPAINTGSLRLFRSWIVRCLK